MSFKISYSVLSKENEDKPWLGVDVEYTFDNFDDAEYCLEQVLAKRRGSLGVVKSIKTTTEE